MTDAQMDRIYDHCNARMRFGQWDQLNAELSVLDMTDCSTDCLLTWLTATLPGKSKLPTRQRISEHVPAELLEGLL